LHDSLLLLIVTYTEDDVRALYLVDHSAWPISVAAFHASGCHCILAAPEHSPDQFRLCWLRPILTGEFARSLVLFQKGLRNLPVSLFVVPGVLFDGLRLQFVLTGLDNCVQRNPPPWT